MEIADRRVATIHFTLLDQQGRQVATTRPRTAVYMHGTGGIVRGLEEALAGKQAGDHLEVEVAPERASASAGHEGLVQTLPRGLLGNGGEPQVGARLKAQTAKGPLDVVVTAVDADTVTVDGNHPLAGRPFRAQVEVVDVRLATPRGTAVRHRMKRRPRAAGR